EKARWLFSTESVSDLLGFEPHEIIGKPSMDLVHPDEYGAIEKLHFDTIRQDKAAVIAYLRLRHKDPYKGYILCAVSRTIVHNVTVGSVSFASPGAKAMHNASTAQEITIISPSAANFEFRRWGDPSPMPPSPIPRAMSPKDTPSPDSSSGSDCESNLSASPSRLSFKTQQQPPPQSVRTALILDRFSVNCPIIYITNDQMLSTTAVMGRSFFDFVSKRDEELVRSWIDVIKSWGVNERGQPSDGGFGFGKFTVCVKGRDSSLRNTEPPSVRHRQKPSGGNPHQPRQTSQKCNQRGGATKAVTRRPSDELTVDAIFSAHSDGLMVILRPVSNTAAPDRAKN
ncbi:hypothetical protein BD410DRAFT_723382, partial [Rickenella mellea]